ncbi:immunity 49 family protein [Nonomuraea sp. NPDC046802]|uniref:immunity 49 family protein n=1 Tax=Nonomuraea sp. NPDC046802 TaxID=3154919 RepID=UPI0033E78DB1
MKGYDYDVDEATIAAARDNFADRIGMQAVSMSKAGPMTASNWWRLSGEFLDYLGALLADTPDLGTPEVRAALDGPAQAAVGAVTYAAYFRKENFQVFLDYVGFGISYDDESEGEPESVTPRQWLDAFCLAILAGTVERHAEAFFWTRDHRDAISGALIAYVTDDPEADAVPPPDDHPQIAAIRTVRALADGDQESFGAGLADLLLPHSTSTGPPRTLLPLLPLALAALARRRAGWEPAIETDYLAPALVAGFKDPGPRVEAYGRNRRPDAVAELAAGPVAFDRPELVPPMDPEDQAKWDEYSRRPWIPGEEPSPWVLSCAMQDQRLLFTGAAWGAADVTDAQMKSLRLASRWGATVFRTVLAEPGTVVELSIDGHTVGFPPYEGHGARDSEWHLAVNLALIIGNREDLTPLLLVGSVVLAKDDSIFASYRQALHDHLRGVAAEPAMDRALRDGDTARSWGAFPPPAVLLSQLIGGDEESFNLALLDALQAHRAYYGVGDRASHETAINLDVLALACHARRQGWAIKVTSPYLPPRLLRHPSTECS